MQCFRFKDRFSKFSHDALYRTSHPVRIPMMGSVFDYCLEEQTGSFIRWSDKQQERMKIMAGGYTLTTEVGHQVMLGLIGQGSC